MPGRKLSAIVALALLSASTAAAAAPTSSPAPAPAQEAVDEGSRLGDAETVLGVTFTLVVIAILIFVLSKQSHDAQFPLSP